MYIFLTGSIFVPITEMLTPLPVKFEAICLRQDEPPSAICASSQVYLVSHKKLLPSFYPKCISPEGSSLRGTHMEPILSSLLALATGCNDEWKLSVMHCFFSCL